VFPFALRGDIGYLFEEEENAEESWVLVSLLNEVRT
jgi:hypothetical protein